jgi:Domain of unknown function (DUF4337)
MSLPEAIDPTTETEPNKLTAIYIAVLAVLIAVASIGDDGTAKTMIRSSIDITDTYSFFQAKNIRQTSYRLASDILEAELADPALPEAARAKLQEKVNGYRATAERYESEPATGEGKKELLAKAKGLEAERDIALRQDPYFDYAQGLLQIAVVLASVSLVIGGSFLLWVSSAMGVLGTIAMLNAFTLWVELPWLS